jgi:hypothetical protein
MEQEELTDEAHYAALEEFSADVRNIRFQETRDNWRALMDFLREHELPTTAANLRFAFLALSKDGLLELMPLGHAAPPQPEPVPAPTPTVQPPPVVVPARARTFAMYRNGKAIEGTVRSL